MSVELDMDTFFGLSTGELAPADAAERSLARVTGALEALEGCFEVLSSRPRPIVSR